MRNQPDETIVPFSVKVPKNIRIKPRTINIAGRVNVDDRVLMDI